jgi:hypothetical protein
VEERHWALVCIKSLAHCKGDLYLQHPGEKFWRDRPAVKSRHAARVGILRKLYVKDVVKEWRVVHELMER